VVLVHFGAIRRNSRKGAHFGAKGRILAQRGAFRRNSAQFGAIRRKWAHLLEEKITHGLQR
jgi:hypothetical protein